MRKNNFYIVLSLCVLLFASCAKEGPTGPTGPAGPVFYGTITGFVHLYDKYGSRVLTGMDRASVTLSSSNTPAAINATTGSFSFGSVGTGNYIIYAADSGYATTAKTDVNFISGTLYQDVGLSAIPDSFIKTFNTSVNAIALTDSLVLTVTQDARARKCIVFVGTAGSTVNRVTSDPNYYSLAYTIDIPANVTTVGYAIPQQDLLDARFVSGSKVYYAAYSYVVNDASVYEDVATGNYFYNAVNAHPVVDSTIVP